jgi:two-component system cell cycle sensor histidine kinase/response regulator CckA
LSELHRVFLALGLVSVCAGSALVFLISHTFTRPLESLVAGVRALQEGNFAYPLEERGGDEVAEVTSAFSRMRASLQKNHDEQKLLEERLRQAHKMEAVGRLAGGVAHDFNNLLTIIRGNGDLLADRGSLDDAQKRCVEQIQKAAGRAVSMTRQLLAFSRMQVLQPVVLDLNGVVSEMGKMLPRLIGEHIEYVFSPEPQLKPVTADPGQIEQVILNLAVNARDAMPNGGTLTLRTTNVSVDAVEAARRPPMSPGDYVLLSITDTGHGMNPETKAHIFEPFFTTKEVGKGTGLGLATVYGIVKQSGGFIWVQSSLGKGTTFEIYLPQASGPVASASPEAKPAALPRGTETILVVEDEPDVRDLASRFLNDRGYNVLTAKDGAHALEVFAQYPGKVHLILTDLVMPRMSGKELCKRVKALRPEVKVLFMSGYADYAHGDPAHTPPPGLFLQKPFSQAALVRFVRNALASGSGIEVANTKDFRFS